MRVLVAILMGAAIAAVGGSMLRGLSRPAPAAPSADEAQPMLHIARITFWCENCGTELLLLKKGTEAPPKHCGEKMISREEVPRA